MLRHEYPSAKIQGCILAPVAAKDYYGLPGLLDIMLVEPLII